MQVFAFVEDKGESGLQEVAALKFINAEDGVKLDDAKN